MFVRFKDYSLLLMEGRLVFVAPPGFMNGLLTVEDAVSLGLSLPCVAKTCSFGTVVLISIDWCSDHGCKCYYLWYLRRVFV